MQRKSKSKDCSKKGKSWQMAEKAEDGEELSQYNYGCTM